MRSGRTPKKESQKSSLRVLFFEDCEEDIELSLRELRSAGFDVEWDAAVTIAEFIDRARTEPYDVILSDYRMPKATGMDVFESMKSEGIETPFILVTGSLGDEKAVECLKRGVADYVLKDRLPRLPVAIRRALEEAWRRAEHARAEEALRLSEASYRSLTQSAPCGILRLSATDGHLLDANSSLAVMLGYDSDADLHKGGAAGGIALDAEALARFMAGGEVEGVVECEVWWKRKDGARVLIRLAGRLLRDANGAPACLEMIAENITERHAARQRIEQLNRLYSVLTHANQTIVRTRESSTLFQEVCRIIVEEGGFQMAWLGLLEPGAGVVIPNSSFPVGDEYLDGFHITAGPEPEGCGPAGTAIRENRSVVWNNVVETPSLASWRERALQRSFRSVAAFPVVKHGRSVGALTIYAAEVNFFDIENVALLAELAADVSFALESIETERMHQRVTDELDQFFALSLDMLCISDMDGYMLKLNPAWETVLGYTAEELRSKPWVEFVHPDDRPRALDGLAGFRSGIGVCNLELRFMTKDGSYRWLVGSATPALDRGVVVAALSDNTARKELEEQLRSQNLKLEERSRRIEAASRMKGEFLANMSHELRSPLNGIIGFSELLYDGKLGALPARPREYVGRIHASASHLLQLINSVLDLSKIEAGHLETRPERLFVSHVIREVTGILGALAAEKAIQIEIEIDAGVDEVTVDGGRLRQLLYNYLSNALKFTGANGRVTVRLKSENADSFRLEVSDTGIGVSEKDIGRLFVEFQQLDASTSKRYQGTGLGLALTKRIVEAQGGRVGVSSRPGEGSTFFAVLPLVPPTTSVPAGVGRILVIDDQPLDRMLLAQVLQAKGCVVETAATCAEALVKCRHGHFDAITLDLVLADGPGWELLAQIRSIEEHRSTPVLVISSCERADVAVPMAVQGFLTKPVWPERLFESLKRAGVPMRTLEVAHE